MGREAHLLVRVSEILVSCRQSLRVVGQIIADTGIHFAHNVNATMDYDPLLENAVYTYLKSKDYRVSVGQIDKLEVDFIARKANEGYAHIQVSLSAADKTVADLKYFIFVHKPLNTFSVFVH